MPRFEWTALLWLAVFCIDPLPQSASQISGYPVSLSYVAAPFMTRPEQPSENALSRARICDSHHRPGFLSGCAALDRDDGQGIAANEEVGLEEQTAEIEAIFLLADVGLETPPVRKNIVAYVQHWLRFFGGNA
jgi:hypothetical protein